MLILAAGRWLVIRLMNEYSVEWPLWDEEGMCPDGHPALPAATADRLRAWAASFNEHYDPFRGWPEREMAEAHQRQAEQLLAELEGILGPGSVRLDLWESTVDGSPVEPRESFGDRVRRWLS
jgi:hypothetical protein